MYDAILELTDAIFKLTEAIFKLTEAIFYMYDAIFLIDVHIFAPLEATIYSFALELKMMYPKLTTQEKDL